MDHSENGEETKNKREETDKMKVWNNLGVQRQVDVVNFIYCSSTVFTHFHLQIN